MESIIHKHVLLKFENLSNKRILILSEESGTRIWCIFTIFFGKLHRLVISKMYLKIPFKVTHSSLHIVEENENKNRHGKKRRNRKHASRKSLPLLEEPRRSILFCLLFHPKPNRVFSVNIIFWDSSRKICH